MKKAFKVFLDPASTEPQVLACLEVLQEELEDLNMAKEWMLMNGHRAVLDTLRSGKIAANASSTVLITPAIRTLLYLTIGHAAQNDEPMQKAFLECNWSALLVPLLRIESNVDARQALCLAVSNLCRGHAASAASFVNGGGFDALSNVLQRLEGSDDYTSISRLLRLVRYFSVEGISWSGADQLLCTYCQHRDDGVRSAAVNALWSLLLKASEQRHVENSPPGGNQHSSALAVDAHSIREKLSRMLPVWKAIPAEDLDEAHVGLINFVEGKPPTS